MEQLLPDKGNIPFFAAVKMMDASAMKTVILKAAQLAPGFAVKLFAEISGMEEEKLLNDPDVGLDGLFELMEAFWEVNGLENFFRGAARMAQGIRGFVRNAGSKG